MDYVDVVTIKPADGSGLVMRTAPAWSCLKEGSEVMFETTDAPYEARGVVVDVATFRHDDNGFKLLKSFAQDVEAHITKLIIYRDFEYAKKAEAQAKGKEEAANG